MGTTDYIITFALIGIIFLQIKEHRVNFHTLIRPAILVTVAAVTYLHGIPTAGNDLVLIGGLTAIGAALGGASAAVTHMRRDAEGQAVSHVGGAAIFLWIAGISTRLLFQFASSHGFGDDITRFSINHDITSANAWVAAFVLMAITEAVTRLAILQYRAWRIRTDSVRTVAVAA